MSCTLGKFCLNSFFSSLDEVGLDGDLEVGIDLEGQSRDLQGYKWRNLYYLCHLIYGVQK